MVDLLDGVDLGPGLGTCVLLLGESLGTSSTKGGGLTIRYLVPGLGQVQS